MIRTRPKNHALYLRTCRLLGLVCSLGACGTIVGNPKKPNSGNTPSSAIVFTAVSDADSQKELVTTQLDAVVAALSDGGAGTGDGVGAGIGLTDDAALLDKSFNEARHCVASPAPSPVSLTGNEGYAWQVAGQTPVVTLTRTMTGKRGHLSYTGNADGSQSQYQETWYPGPYFGLQNVKPSSSIVRWGDVTDPTTGHGLADIPYAKGPAGAPAGSSGLVGSVGWRSSDGSWRGAPVWESGVSYSGTISSGALAASATTGMVMYFANNMPTYSCASGSPAGGVCVAEGVAMSPVVGHATHDFAVLGYARDSLLPSFQSTGQGPSGPLAQAGSVAVAGVPARMYNPPETLACDSLGFNASPGWKFSQNVAGLTRRSVSHITAVRALAKGNNESVTNSTQVTVWSDPALVAPSSGGGAFFDENGGTFTQTRRLSLGTVVTPDTASTTYTPTNGAAHATLSTSSYTSKPLEDTIVRSLLSKTWDWTKRTVASGAIVTAHAVNGEPAVATIETSYQGLVFVNDPDDDKACVPTAGLITAVIKPVDTTQQTTTITLRFGSSAQVSAPDGVTAMVSCSDGQAGASNCTAQAEVDDADYRPSGCNF